MSILEVIKKFFKWFDNRPRCFLCDGLLGWDWEHLWYSSLDEDGVDQIYKEKICRLCAQGLDNAEAKKE